MANLLPPYARAHSLTPGVCMCAHVHKHTRQVTVLGDHVSVKLEGVNSTGRREWKEKKRRGKGG